MIGNSSIVSCVSSSTSWRYAAAMICSAMGASSSGVDRVILWWW